jgi:transcriptional regulator with XRE-family HTH domain
MTISAAQLKGARKLLGWRFPALATQSGVDASHLEGFERGRRRLSVLDLSVIQRALEAAGVEFTNEASPGLKLRRAKRYELHFAPAAASESLPMMLQHIG